VRNIAKSLPYRERDLSKKITVDVRGEILQLKETLNTMVEQLRSFAAEGPRAARWVAKGARWKANVPASPAVEGFTDSVNAMAGNLTGQVRNIAE